MPVIDKIDQADFFINEIDEIIANLKLRRAAIVATKPAADSLPMKNSFVGPSGRVFKIKGRKNP